MLRASLRTLATTSFFAVLSCGAGLLTGCTLQNTPASSAELVPGTAISGTVHGGSTPIFGAKVYLLAVNPTGYGGPGISASSANASVSLLKASSTGNIADTIGSFVLTNNTTGGFMLSGDYSCTSGFAQSTGSAVALSGSEQIYLYVLGGAPSYYNSSTANTSSGELVALGPCNSPTAQVAINEITTVATGYAFAGFATDATHIGSSGTALALKGLTNAFANVANLAAVATGTAAASSGSITRPVAAVTTIADILAACVNGTTANTNCGTLFQYTESSGATGTATTDTATAAINLAHNPWPTAAGMTALFALVPSTGAPFAGALSSKPTDFTLTVNISSAPFGSGGTIAIDASGNAWVSSGTAVGIAALYEFTSSGTALSSTSGYTGGGLNFPFGVAIDASGNVWIANGHGNSLSKFSSAGTAISGSSGYTGGGINYPIGIAIDASGNVWTGNLGNASLSEFTNAGTAISSSSGYTGGGLGSMYAIAIDSFGNVWSANFDSSLSEFSNAGTAISGSSGYTGGGLSAPVDVAIDASGNVWVANSQGYNVSKFSNAGTAVSSSGYMGGGLNQPNGIAIDASGNVWVSNIGSGYVSEFNSSGTALSSSSGYTGTFQNADAVAIDGSGDVWVAGYTNSIVAELIGAAAPVVTPVVANFLVPYGSSTVNRP